MPNLRWHRSLACPRTRTVRPPRLGTFLLETLAAGKPYYVLRPQPTAIPDELLDDEDVVLQAGDVIIQRGTNHCWANRSDKLARMAFILIDGVDENGNKRG